MEKIEWKPTDEEKKKISKICDDCIELMEELPANQTAFALKCLIDSFEEVSGINVQSVIITN